ncbi:holo-ACP synthase [Mechercharimyces sp. CAU 1602]|uniref:holo-ACP synthase n=1 Tax=Mechercharimyces sp. CAU 1602 TaxID=2973933 RepID=UPI0021618E48|nr:holo-ACP synthase [Mechercharimyces sp. CAU 1602]MCS1352145.1 holo-ACP synthase [Mechercharimyces sp. CAU 1602]
MIIGIGTDLVEMDRIREIGVDRLLKRILTEEEQKLLSQHERRRLEMVAGRFAAKEAVVKAAGTGIGSQIGFLDIDVVKDKAGRPYLRLSERAQKNLGWGEDVSLHLSISHTKAYATAIVVVERLASP